MSGFASSRSHISCTRAVSSTSSSIMRPTRTLLTPSKPEGGQRALHGLSLWVEDALLGADEHPRRQAPARSSQRWNGSPAIRS